MKVFVTLTYGSQWPTSGRRVKDDWRAFTERLRRLGYFMKESIIWFLEFQARGAPHFHFLATGWIPKSFVAEAWADITEGNARSCSRVEGLKHPEAAGAYAAKYAAKNEQKAVPLEYKDVGRFWGVAGLARTLAREGLPVCPSLSAVLPRVGPGPALEKIFCLEMGIRVYETPIGWVIYGTEREIRRAWNWLTKTNQQSKATPAGLFATTTTNGDHSQPPTRPESSVTPEKAVRNSRKYWHAPNFDAGRCQMSVPKSGKSLNGLSNWWSYYSKRSHLAFPHSLA